MSTLIKKKIKKILIENLNLDKKCLTNKDLIGDNILDSFNIILLISEIDKEFKIKIKNKNFDTKHFRNYKKLCEFIQNLKK